LLGKGIESATQLRASHFLKSQTTGIVRLDRFGRDETHDLGS